MGLLEKTIGEDGIDGALDLYEIIREAEPSAYYFDETAMNEVGYRLLGKGKTPEAIEIFKINVSVFPESYNAYDSLGEAYMIAGNKERAVENYRKSLELHPGSMAGIEALKKLGVE